MFDQEDFATNPSKYRLFRTARIAERIDSIPELSVGQLVWIRYFDTCVNHGRGKREMPIYHVWIDASEDLKDSPCMVYACALKDFCL